MDFSNHPVKYEKPRFYTPRWGVYRVHKKEGNKTGMGDACVHSDNLQMQPSTAKTL